MQAGFAFSKFADHLMDMAELSTDDFDLIARMPSRIGHFSAHQHILHKGDQPTHCCLLLQGYLSWQDVDNRDGQITSIYVPGDVPDLHTIHDAQLDCDLISLGTSVVAFVPHTYFREICIQSPSMSRALLRLLMADMADARNWIINLGSRDALTRVAHLLCEIATRLRSIGLASDLRFPSPFTQSDLAAACGISAVHANRIIQELRRSKLLQWQSKTITITNWSGLVHLAGFDSGYLRMRDRERSNHAPHVVLRAPADAVLS